MNTRRFDPTRPLVLGGVLLLGLLEFVALQRSRRATERLPETA